jgi:sporulation integral membrane protein YtvI
MINSINSKLITVILASIILWFGIIAIKNLLFFFLPFIIAFLIASLLNPITGFFSKLLKIKRKYTKLILVLFFFFLLAFIFITLTYAIINQIVSFGKDIPQITEYLSSQYDFISEKYDFLPPDSSELLKKVTESLLSSLSKAGTFLGKTVIVSFGLIPLIIFYTIVTILATIFILLQRDELFSKFYDIFDKSSKIKNFLGKFKKDAILVVGAYIKAQLVIMLFSFTIAAVSLSLLNVKYSLLIALGIAILDALPVFGAGSIYLPWIAISAILQDYVMSISLVATYIIQTMSRQSLEPKLISQQIGVNPLLTLIAVYTGFKLFGVIGIILGPLLVITFVAYKKV